MKTNLLTSRLHNCPGTQASSPAFKEVRSEVLSRLVGSRTIICPGAQPNSPASPERRGGGTGAGWYTRLQAALNNKTAIRFAKYLIPITILLLFFLLLSLTSCKSPAVITNNESHRTRDSNYHASVQRIETHDTIIFGAPSIEYPSPIIRISDRKITIHDTVFIARTDTLLRTQIITQKERYIPPLYRCAP